MVGPSYRVLATTVIQLYWAVAYMALTGIAYLLRDRFTLHICISAPLALLLLLYWYDTIRYDTIRYCVFYMLRKLCLNITDASNFKFYNVGTSMS